MNKSNMSAQHAPELPTKVGLYPKKADAAAG
jgi:hypothetical protein